jgi:uncharacterized protein
MRRPRPERSRRRLLIAVLAIVLAVPAAVYGSASWMVYERLSATPGECPAAFLDNTPERFSAPGVDPGVLDGYRMPAPVPMEFRSRDPRVPDLVLRGWWIAGSDPAGPAVVLVHGLGSCRRSPTVLLPAGMLHRQGFGVLLIDQRDHGESDDEDGRFAGGTEEYLDILGARDWLVARGVPAERIGLLGMSFGAATVLIAAGNDPTVPAVWADSSFADIRLAIRDYLVRLGYPAWLEHGGVFLARIVAGDDLTAQSPLEAVRALTGRSLAIVHGLADDVLPPRYADALIAAGLEAGVDVRVSWILEAVGHTDAVFVATAEYEQRLVDFFRDTLGSPGAATGSPGGARAHAHASP